MVFIPTYFSHSESAGNFPLITHPDSGIPDFLDQHCNRLPKDRRGDRAAARTTTVTMSGIPDGYRISLSTRASRANGLTESRTESFAEPMIRLMHLDAVEAKLFGHRRGELYTTPRGRPDITGVQRGVAQSS